LAVSDSLVSVIIPVYNGENYLAEAIRSAIDQSWPTIEVLVIDDGSTDNSVSIAEEFGAEKVRCFRQSNKGASSARNLGLSKASGKYIQFLDADDILSADKIMHQVQALVQNPNHIAVCSTVHFINGENHRLSSPSAYEDAFIYSTPNVTAFLIKLWGGYDFKGSMIQPNAWLTPRSLIESNGPWNEELSVDDDGEFFARMVLGSAGVIKTAGLNYYRKHPASKQNLSSQKTRANLQSALKAIRLKKNALFASTREEPAQKAIYRQLNELRVICYNFEPAVYAEVCKELSGLPNYNYNVVVGGRLLNTIARIAGWRFAKRLQQLYAAFKLK
jgi:glycosyltransferase involved in cell wall biosynthesis